MKASAKVGHKITFRKGRWAYVAFSKDSGRTLKIVYEGDANDTPEIVTEVARRLLAA